MKVQGEEDVVEDELAVKSVDRYVCIRRSIYGDIIISNQLLLDGSTPQIISF